MVCNAGKRRISLPGGRLAQQSRAATPVLRHAQNYNDVTVTVHSLRSPVLSQGTRMCLCRRSFNSHRNQDDVSGGREWDPTKVLLSWEPRRSGSSGDGPDARPAGVRRLPSLLRNALRSQRCSAAASHRFGSNRICKIGIRLFP
jgi:hypothetical protein